MNTSETSSGRVLGAVLLIAGCCIGAGMLGLPTLTALGGFKPTLLMFVFSWLFMVVTGLLLLEVNLWFKEEVNIVTMAGQTLGNIGRILAWSLFAFLFYSLMIAYVSGSGQLFSDFFEETFYYKLPEWIGSLGISLLFGVFLYLGTQTVDRINRILMVGLIASYLFFIILGSGHVNWELLQHVDWKMAVYATPAMIISFGYHNLIPSLTTYLKHDVKKLRLAILVGSAIPLFFYLLWEWLILGIVPVEGDGGFREALGQGDMATRALRNVVGKSWIADIVEYFAFFAIVTSFLSVALSFVDFLADGLHIKKDSKGKILLCALSLTPPFVLALYYPKIFLIALSYAGAFGTTILFGVIPVAMVWLGRYRENRKEFILVPGGKLTLILVLLFSIGVMILEMLHQL